MSGPGPVKEGLPAVETAGILIIGNEILTGKVADVNAPFLIEELRGLGRILSRITVIPDDIVVVGREAVRMADECDVVFTSGGVGPTHDDVTMEGIAHGFGVSLIRHPELKQRFISRYGPSANEVFLKMADVPEGTEIIDLGEDRFPVVKFRNIYILPGIPKYLREKFIAIRERFRTKAFLLRRLFIAAEEFEIAEVLTEAVARHEGVVFGSYPAVDNPGYRVIITAESKSEDELEQAVRDLVSGLPAGSIVRTE